MFTHVMVGSNDIDASKALYDAVFGAIGLPAGQLDPKGRIFYRTKTGAFGITKPIDGAAACHANGGKSIEDPPGWRQGAAGRIYLAYLRDPAGNKIVAVHRGA